MGVHYFLIIGVTRLTTSKLSFLYLISFLDRTNIGNAKIDGLQKDLNMTNNQYNISLTVFFISYSLFEPLTNVLLKKLRPSIFLPAIMIMWGIVMATVSISFELFQDMHAY